MADGSIIIDTHIDNAQAQKELSKLKKDISKLSTALAGKTTEQSAIAKEMQQADAAIEGTYQNIKKLEAELASMESVNLKDNTPAEYLIAQTRIPQIKAELEQQYASMEKQGQAADKVAARYEKITAEVNKISSELDEAKTKAGELAQQVEGAGKASKRASKATDGAASATARFKKRIIELTKSALIFSVLTKAITVMRDWLGRAAASSEEAASAFASFKGSLQGLAAPILSAVIPALVKIVQVITQIISLISRGVAALFGMTNKQALDSAKSLNAEQEALEGVGGAASDAEKQLASFDEINKLTEPSSGGGGGIDTNAPSFEEVELPPWMAAAAEKLADAFGRLRDAWSSLKENPAFQKIVDAVKELVIIAAETVIEGLATAINILSGALTFVDQVLSGDFLGAFDTFLGLLYDIIKLISSPVQNAAAWLFSLFGIDYDWETQWDEQIKPWFTVARWQQLFNNVKQGVINGWNAVKTWWENSALVKWWNNSVKPWFTKARWMQLWDDVRTFFVTGWENIKTWWQNSALVVWWKDNVAPWFTKARWGQLWDDVKLFFVTGWESIKTWWQNSALVVWWRDDVAPWFTSERWGQLWDDVKSFFVDGWTSISEWWQNSALVIWWKDNVAPYFTVERWSELWANVQTAFINGWVAIQTWWKQTTLVLWWQNDVAPWFTAAKWQSIWDGVKRGFIAGWESVKTWWNTAIASWWSTNVAVWFTAEKWSSAMGGITSAFSSAFTSAANAAIGVLNSMISWINQKLRFTIPSLTIMGETLWDSKYVVLASLPSIPYLAQGAVIPPNREFMAVLGDQKSGTNIETPLATMLQAFRQALNEGGYGGSRTIVLEVDKRELGRVTFDVYNAEAQRLGVSLGGV